MRIRLPKLAALAALAAAALVTPHGGAQAQTWPAKPIRWVVPYTPGGITDNVTRLVTQRISAALGQPITVENRPGANSIIGVDNIAKSAPDGYAFVTVIAAHAANATLYEGRLPFDHAKALQPVSLVGIAPLILTVSNAFPPKDVRELIAFAKANPGRISYGSSGIGAAAHLTTELLRQTTGIDMVHVPYKGTAPALTDLMSGNIQMLVDVPSTMMPHVRGGKIRALGMFSAKRVPGAQEVPTLAEAGGPLIESSTWLMFLAPAGTPREIVTRMAQETGNAVRSPELSARFAELAIEAVGSSPEAAAKFLQEEIIKWARVIRAAGVKAE